MTINPMKYISAVPNYRCNNSFAESVVEGIKTIGKSGEYAVKKQNGKYIMAKKASDLLPEIKGVTPRGWPEGMTWDDAPALNHQNGFIGCFSEPNIKTSYDMQSIIRHETGHSLDNSFIKTIGMKFTDTKGYIDSYSKDIAKINKKLPKYGLDINDIEYQIQNSTPKNTTVGGRMETFAEIFANLRGGSMANVEFNGIDKIMGELFPKTFAYVKKLLCYLGDK